MTILNKYELLAYISTKIPRSKYFDGYWYCIQSLSDWFYIIEHEDNVDYFFNRLGVAYL